MLSNHNTPFINELYKDYRKEIVLAKRAINSNASKR
jgi:DNA adenine methylase